MFVGFKFKNLDNSSRRNKQQQIEANSPVLLDVWQYSQDRWMSAVVFETDHMLDKLRWGTQSNEIETKSKEIDKERKTIWLKKY